MHTTRSIPHNMNQISSFLNGQKRQGRCLVNYRHIFHFLVHFMHPKTISRLSMIVRVNVVLNRTVVADSD